MAGLTNNFLLNPLLGQPFLGAEGEDGHDKLFAASLVAPSELDISPVGLAVILCMVKSKGHRPLLAFKGASDALTRTPPRPANPP